MNDKFQVRVVDEQFMVNLQARTCTCRGWQLTGIPCIHGVSYVHYMKLDATKFIDVTYKKEMYLQAYSCAIKPLNGKSIWPSINDSPVTHPKFRKMLGRPKIKRKKATEERYSSKLSKHGV